MINWLNRLYTLGVSERAVSRQTGIPRSTLYAYRTKLFEPPKERTTIVHDYYRRVQYRRLRERGASVITANRFKNATMYKVDEIRDWHDGMVKHIADVYEVDEDYIRMGLSKSKKNIEEIEMWY